jgi:fructoselysine-6-P-deglycase FrlB-like protein
MHAHTFRATLEEINSQATDIPSYISYLKSLNLENQDPQDVLICGAGDSLACSKFVETYMNYRTRAFDPYDLILHPEAARDKIVYFLSVSGRTRANIEVAKKVKHAARYTVAITANVESKLVKSCSKVIELRFSKAHAITPGTNSFTASLTACASIFNSIPPIRAREILKNANKWASKIPDTKGTFHFVGTGEFYGIAMYGAAKIYEYCGGSADYQRTEEFSHLNLFATKRKDSVLILDLGESDERARELHSKLESNGVNSCILPSIGVDSVSNAIFRSICTQFLALKIARGRGLKQPAFLNNEALLNISDQMIY